MTTIGMDAQIPILNSYPSAKATIYMDFDGQYVEGTTWNWSGPINAQPALLSEAAITEIFNRVSEDYRIFNINITTDSTVYYAAPASQRTRVIVTPSYEWYGMAGGVSFVGSFTWGDDTPAWVFSGLLNNNIKSVAEAISHEAGHTLGLQHQSVWDGNCNKTAEYAPGQGSGEIGWAPIMGVGYYKNLTTLFNGPNSTGCNNLQNDIAIIAGNTNKFGFRSDDHGNTPKDATKINFSGLGFSASGLINSATDKDVFSFNLASSTNFSLNVIPVNVGTSDAGANVDIRVSLLNQFADTIGRYNPSDLLDAGVDSNLNAGTYYIVVEGTGNTNLIRYGSVGAYTLTGSIGNLLPVHHLTLTGTGGNQHTLTWQYESDDSIRNTEIEYSEDGKNFSRLAQLPETSRDFSWKPVDNSMIFYRVRVTIAKAEEAFYSNVITLQGLNDRFVKLAASIVDNHILVNTGKDYSYQLFDATGRLLQHGKLSAGSNTIDVSPLYTGILILQMHCNGGYFAARLIKR
jgi:hypothetical protein